MNDRTAMTGEWLAFCAACSAPEIANVFNRTGIAFQQVTGTLEDDPECWREIDEWIRAAQVASVLEHNRLGLMGHYYGGMLDIYTDVTQQCACFGGHVEFLELDELAKLRRGVTPAEISARLIHFREAFEIQPVGDRSRGTLERDRPNPDLPPMVELHGRYNGSKPRQFSEVTRAQSSFSPEIGYEPELLHRL